MLVQASVLWMASACTSVPPAAPPTTPATAVQRGATVTPAEHHDESPPLRDLPPAARPPEDMKREVPIHRIPLPPRG
jgi:hypothetical protein